MVISNLKNHADMIQITLLYTTEEMFLLINNSLYLF